MLQEASTEIVISMSLIFARLGSALSQFPAISTNFVLMNGRLAIALATSVILYPILQKYMPSHLSTGQYLTYLIFEIMIGFIISIAAKICFSAIDTVGSIMSMQSGLSAAMFFDPNHNEQKSLMSNFFLLIGYVMIFVTDTHYLFFEAVVDSYSIFAIGDFPNLGDLSEFVSKTVNQSFILAFKLASPFIAVSLAFLISNGALSRLMPNLQVFFVVTPAQIFVMFLILFIVINLMMGKFIEAVRGAIHMKDFV
jgi:flagellar biosynthetic protein FliR